VKNNINKYNKLTWKEKINSYCSCFINKDKSNFCNNNCNLSELKTLLSQKKLPTRKTICKIFIKSRIFTRHEIIFALCEIHKTIFKSAKRRLEEAIVDLKKENYTIITDNNQVIKAYASITKILGNCTVDNYTVDNYTVGN